MTKHNKIMRQTNLYLKKMGACLTAFRSFDSWDSRLLSMSDAAAVASFTPLRINSISSASAGSRADDGSHTSETMSPPTVITGAALLACLGDVINDAVSLCSQPPVAESADAVLPSVSTLNRLLISLKNERKKNSES